MAGRARHDGGIRAIAYHARIPSARTASAAARSMAGMSAVGLFVFNVDECIERALCVVAEHLYYVEHRLAKRARA